jgi:hypothetical protein
MFTPFFLDRILVFLLSLGGIICSALAASSCEFFHFYSYSHDPWPGLEPPFNDAIAANVGLFMYEITDSTELSDLNEGCIAYDRRFSEFPEGNALLEGAQWCALFAMIASGLAFLTNLFEAVCCSFFCSYIFACTLLCVAGVLHKLVLLWYWEGVGFGEYSATHLVQLYLATNRLLLETNSSLFAPFKNLRRKIDYRLRSCASGLFLRGGMRILLYCRNIAMWLPTPRSLCW